MAYGDHYAKKQPSDLGVRSKSYLNRRFYRYAAQYCPPPPLKILEVGAGHGFFAKACIEAGNHYSAVEPNSFMSDLLAGQDLDVRQSLCPPIPFPAEQFDLVYTGYLLEYLPSSRVAFEFLDEVKRVLRPGGVFANVSSDYLRMRKEFWNVSYLVSFATTERRIKQLLFDTGFHYLDTQSFAGNLFGPARFLAYAFYSIYSYRLLDTLFGQRSKLDSRFYKLRVTFPEGLLSIARKGAD